MGHARRRLAAMKIVKLQSKLLGKHAMKLGTQLRNVAAKHGSRRLKDTTLEIPPLIIEGVYIYIHI